MATIRPEEITSILKTKIENYNVETDVNSIGSVLSVGDGIARLYGLKNAMSSELVEFDDENNTFVFENIIDKEIDLSSIDVNYFVLSSNYNDVLNQLSGKGFDCK